jgi:hypothetical protein
MGRIRPHLTYSNVMVTLLAVVVLGGGGAYAAELVANNSVDTNSIIDGEVKPDDLANKSELAKGLDRDAVAVYPKKLTSGDVRQVGANKAEVATRGCPDEADIPVSGGVYWLGDKPNIGPVTQSYPDALRKEDGTPRAWTVSVRNDTDISRSYAVYVVCINAKR